MKSYGNRNIHTVLREVLDELKEVKQKQEEESKSILHLREKLEKNEQTLPVGKPIPPAGDSLTITSMINKELFPEHNAIEYYRIVFGRLIFWMIINSYFDLFVCFGKEI